MVDCIECHVNSDTDRSMWRFPLIETRCDIIVVEQKWLSVRVGIHVGQKMGAGVC